MVNKKIRPAKNTVVGVIENALVWLKQRVMHVMIQHQETSNHQLCVSQPETQRSASPSPVRNGSAFPIAHPHICATPLNILTHLGTTKVVIESY